MPAAGSCIVFGREEQAFNEYAQAYRLKPDDVQAARHLAFIAARTKHFDVADKWFIETLRLAPEDADMHFNHGFVLEQDGRSREAVSAFAEAVRLKPSLDRAWYGLGLAHARLGEHVEAATAFARCCRTAADERRGLLPMGHGLPSRQPARAGGPDRQTPRRFRPKRALKLIKDAERADLKHLVPEEVRRFFEVPGSSRVPAPEPSKKEPAVGRAQ
ncbi:MAG: tetratricopeptide repeat protein [Rhodocyclales bacterium]|nr:tetratricopeptide repeat protein [Rhodocyclales bacterium]